MADSCDILYVEYMQGGTLAKEIKESFKQLFSKCTWCYNLHTCYCRIFDSFI